MPASGAFPVGEALRFRFLMNSYGLKANAFELRDECYVTDYGPALTLVLVTGPTCAVYSRTDEDWLDQLQRDLQAGLYRTSPP